jgi:hypothetical protein
MLYLISILNELKYFMTVIVPLCSITPPNSHFIQNNTHVLGKISIVMDAGH